MMSHREIHGTRAGLRRPRAASAALAPCAVVVLLALTAGCAGGPLFGRAAPEEDVEFAKRYLALFPSRSYPAIEMGMDPSVKDPQLRQKLAQMAGLFPPGEPTAVQAVVSRTRESGGTATSSLSFQYEYPGRWILAEVVVERTGQASVVKGVHVQPLPDSLDRINRVTLAGKGPAHYAAAAVAVLVLVFVLYTFVLAIRTPAPGTKWLWALCVLVGFGHVAFNWTTGQLTIAPMNLKLFGSGFIRPSPFEPLLITTSIPVGAIVYLIQRREWRQDAAPPPPADAA